MLDGSLIFTDPPRHRQLRKLINTGFTRRQVAILEPKLRTFARAALDSIDPDAGAEFAEQIAAPLPTRMIAELLGAPDQDWEQFRTWSDATVGMDDPDVELDTFTALGQLYEYFQELISLRRSGALGHADDLLSVLVAHAGRVLTHRQLLREVWGPSHAGQSHYLRVYMAHLRQKIEADPSQPAHLLTETGVGYRLWVG